MKSVIAGRRRHQADMTTGFNKKLIRSKSGLRIVSSSDNYVSPLMLTEPPWVPDNETTMCMACQKKFDFLTRRHHCRRCGRIYCNACCDKKVALPRMCFVDPVRMCDSCAAITGKENDFFDRKLKTLLGGATFFLDIPPIIDTATVQYVTCKLTADHRQLIFEGVHVEDFSPLDLTAIKSFGISRDDTNDYNQDDDEGSSSVSLLYSPNQRNERRLRLSSAPEPHRRTANAWIAALQEAFKLLHQQTTPAD